MDTKPIIVDFPLRGEWVAYHTPADRIPSHGTDELAQRYAYDFVQIDKAHEGWKFFRSSMLHYYVFGARLEDCYAWGQPIHAPFEGIVVTARDGWTERNPVHFVRDFAVLLKNALTFDPKRSDSLMLVVGNHVVLKMQNREVYALIAHAQRGSVRVRVGEQVQAGSHVAAVGHSGNSTAPHLHFHLMDGPDLLSAQALPCGFRGYEVYREGRWEKVSEGIPGKREFIRDAA